MVRSKSSTRRGPHSTHRQAVAPPLPSTLAWIGLLLLRACALLPSTKDPYDLSIVAGFKAGAACSAVFVAGRPAEALADAELAGMFDETKDLPASEVAYGPQSALDPASI